MIYVKILRSLALALIILVLFSTRTLATNKIDEINKAIKAKGAKWVAGENWITRLSPEEQRQLFGALMEPPADAPLINIPIAANLPKHFDWRDNNGNWMTPVKDQFSPNHCGSCWDFAAVAQVEAWWKITNLNPDTLLDLSEQFILSCSGAGSCNGGDEYRALEFIRDSGVPRESCFPYQAQDLLCNQACEDWREQRIFIPGVFQLSINPPDVEVLKSAVLHQPITVSFTVYEDFNAYESGVYEHVYGAVRGHHAVVIVGWDDLLECWIVKNSQGEDWGEAGYFRIKWGDIDFGKFPAFIWESSAAAKLTASTDSIHTTLTMGDISEETFSLVNEGDAEMSFFISDNEKPRAFHPDGFNAYDDVSWWCGYRDVGGYGNLWLQYLDTPIIDLSTTSDPRLSFGAYWAVDDITITNVAPPAGYSGWDGCNVWISSDGGDSFKVIEPIEPAYRASSLVSFGHETWGWGMGKGIPGWIGYSGIWKLASFDLKEYISDRVVIRFAFASNPGVCSYEDESLLGYFVDEITITDGEHMVFEEHGNNNTGMVVRGDGEKRTPWLKTTASTYNLAAGDSAQINIEIVADNVHPGVHQGQFRVLKNDSTQDFIGPFYSIDILPPQKELWLQPIVKNFTLPRLVESQWDVVVGNFGKDTESCIVTCIISKDDSIYFDDQIAVDNLPPMQSRKLTFAGFVPQVQDRGWMTMHYATDMTSDYDPDNNNLEFQFSINNTIDDFESPNTYWDYQGGWARVANSSAHSGTFCVHNNGGNRRYVDNMDATMTFTPGIYCQGLRSLELIYYANYYTEQDVDVCYIEVSSDMSSWIKADSLSGRITMQRYDVELMDFVEPGASKIWFRFHFISNESLVHSGIVIDDIQIIPKVLSQVTQPQTTMPLTWKLEQNYPNPFNPTTTITYDLARTAHVQLTIYDVLGQQVKRLVDMQKPAGQHQITWDALDDCGEHVTAGLYFCRMETEGFVQTRKMLLVK